LQYLKKQQTRFPLSTLVKALQEVLYNQELHKISPTDIYAYSCCAYDNLI